MNNEQLQQLKALAEAATPGPWKFLESSETESEGNACRPLTICSPDDDDLANVYSTDDSTVNISRLEAIANAGLIAAANPAAILALIAKVESLAADAERYRWLRDHGCISAPVKAADMTYDPPEWTDSAVDACMAKEKA